MAATSSSPTSFRVNVAVQTLRRLGAPVTGPFVTPQRNRIYMVDACILTDTELVGLQEEGKLRATTISQVILDLRRQQTA